MKTIIIAAGCFWGVQAYYKLVRGVVSTKVGYIQGSKEFPTYDDVVSDLTGHAEACLIKYDNSLTNLTALLEHLLSILEGKKECENRFRNGVFYSDDMEKEEIQNFFDSKNVKSNIKRIQIQVESSKEFWEAEEYHQNFLEKNNISFCHISNEKFIMCSKIDESYKKHFK